MSDLEIKRNFSADPDMVFAFVTEPDHLLKWWGPEGLSVAEHTLDFTRPGEWSSVIVNADGKRFKMSGVVKTIDPPNSIELTWGWHDENDVRGHESLVRFEIKPDGDGGTQFTLLHTGLADDESAANHNLGWTSALKKLERMAN